MFRKRWIIINCTKYENIILIPFLYFSYYVYEIASQSYFILTPSSDDKTTPILQKVLWAPSASVLTKNKYFNNDNKVMKSSNSNSGDMKTPNQAAAFVYNNDVYYKPSIQGDVINRITKNGKLIF